MQNDNSFQAPEIKSSSGSQPVTPYCMPMLCVVAIYAGVVWSAAAIVNYVGVVNVGLAAAGYYVCIGSTKGC